MKKVLIVGLGWLGKPLAKQLMEEGYDINGTVTSTDKCERLIKNGFNCDVYQLGESLNKDQLKCDVLIFTIPPSGDEYLNKLRSFADQLPKNLQIVFISSSSVYPNINGVVKEEDAMDIPSTHTGISLLKAERVFTEKRLNPTIIRFTGLFGPDRMPGRFLSGKENVSGADNPVNMIHLEDCIGLIDSVIKQNIRGEVFNGCADSHPTKKEFYTVAANKGNLMPPSFSTESSPFKIVDNTKSKKVLGYTYKFPDVIRALDSI